MPEIAHDSIFGWINGFRFSQSNIIVAANHMTSDLYPPIIRSPTFVQTLHNWNRSDTAVTLLGIFISSFVSYNNATLRSGEQVSHFAQRQIFSRLMFSGFLFSFFLGWRNSYYRLEGLVPNGLAQKNPEVPVKWDYTT